MKKSQIPKHAEINGVMFENISAFTKKGMSIVTDIETHNLLNLFDLYNRPSNIKQNIYEDWKKWFFEIDNCISNFGCLRGSSMTFSIGAYFIYKDCACWCYITKSHNYVVRVSTLILDVYAKELFFEKGIKL